MIVITRNGKTTVISGWRAWLVGTAAFVAVTALLFVVAFVMLGLAVTVTTILLIVVPVLIGVALIASLVRSTGAR